MDDVLADFDGEFYRKWLIRHPGKNITPPEKRTRFYLKEESPEDYASLIAELYTQKGFVRTLPVIPGSLGALKYIEERGHTLFICTTPLLNYDNCVLEKYQWIEQHLGRDWTQKLILTRDKTLVRGDILIDDKPVITGILKPLWEHILFDRSYNSQILNQRRITWENFKSVLTEI